MSDMRDMVGRHIESSAMIIRIISPLLLSCDVHPIGYCLGCFLNLDPEMFRNICLGNIWKSCPILDSDFGSNAVP